MTAEHRQLRARVAAAARNYPDQPDRAVDDRRTLRALRAEQYLQALLAGSPPLTPTQRARLAALLTDGVGQDGAA
jgi:hypothetical protein